MTQATRPDAAIRRLIGTMSILVPAEASHWAVAGVGRKYLDFVAVGGRKDKGVVDRAA